MEFRVQEVFRFHRFVRTMWLASFFSQFLPNRNLHNSTLWGEEISCDYPAVWKSSFNLKARESDKLQNESLLSTHGSQGVDPFPSTRWQRRLLKASPLTSAPSGCYDLMVCSLSKLIHTYPITALTFSLSCCTGVFYSSVPCVNACAVFHSSPS